MPFIPLPINQDLYNSADDSSLSLASPERHDTYLDESGSMSRRPGLDSFVDVGPGPINGMFYWEEKDIVCVVSGKNFYTLSEGGTSTTIATDVFNPNTRVIFDEAVNPSRKIFATNGGVPVVFDGTTAAKLTDSNAPSKATHLALFDTYLIANQKNTQKVEYSGVGTPEVFSAEFFVAETHPDNIVFVGSGWDEIACFGTKTQEFFYNDGTTPFAVKPGALVQQGCIAPYSIQLIDNAWFFLNDERRVVRVNGRQPLVLSSPVDKFLSDITTISDSIADNFTIGGNTFYVLTFPTANKTIVFDYSLNKWAGEWGWWDDHSAKYNRWIGNYVLYVPKWNVHLVGDYRGGKIYKANQETYKDGDKSIRTAWLTGNIDHGTSAWKKSIRLRIRIKRGHGDINTDESPILMVRYRDNGAREWGNTHNIDLGKQGQDEFYKEIGPLGRYRSRQYEISITDNVPLTLVSVMENVEGAENA